MYPSGHSPHSRLPSVSSHDVSSSQPPLSTLHCFVCKQRVNPDPESPSGHSPHSCPPGMFVHVAWGAHPPFAMEHSSMRVHVAPSPEYPSGHVEHKKPPGMFVQVETELQAEVSKHISNSHVIPSPHVPSGQDPHWKPTPGAGISVQTTPSKQGAVAQPSKFTQEVWPVPEYPSGHELHLVIPVDASSLHAVNGSQPPLLLLQFEAARHPVDPCPRKPSAHCPHKREPGVFVHNECESQPPLSTVHSSMSSQSIPSPL